MLSSPLGALKDKDKALPDVSAMSFTIAKYAIADKVTVDNWFRKINATAPAPEGQRFVIVTLTGRLEGLRKRFQMVPKIHKQFVALYGEGGAKQSSAAMMIRGIFGWEIQDQAWALGKVTDPACEDSESFTVAFALPLKWNRFQVAVLKPGGSGQFVPAGEIDLAETVQPKSPGR